jgi:hypothetical protein
VEAGHGLPPRAASSPPGAVAPYHVGPMPDEAGDQPRVPPLSELYLIGGLPLPLRAGLAVLAAGTAVGWGFAALGLHESEAAALGQGARAGALGQLFATGSSPLTAWPGWAMTVLLGLAALHLRRGPLEPPVGRGPGPGGGATALRRGLRREYLVVRCLLVALSLLALADLGRLGVAGGATLAGVDSAGDGLGWNGLEAAGLVAAAAALALWLAAYREKLTAVGALPPLPPRGRPPLRLRSAGPPRSRRRPPG